VGLSLIAFDTDHIKGYVFATNKLKEIRGASSLLDYLNREIMLKKAKEYSAECIYANGGSGLFSIDTEQAEKFGLEVQQEYRDRTAGGASITYVYEPLPEGNENIPDILKLLQWRLQEKKLRPPDFIALPSNPFMRPCDSCGVEYAAPEENEEQRERMIEPGEQDELYCKNCQKKRIRDNEVKTFISQWPANWEKISEPLWGSILNRLGELDYKLRPWPDLPSADRPPDFNAFSLFKGTKDYLGLIYADANNMGKEMQKCLSLPLLKDFATRIDHAIYDAVCTAIAKYLRIEDHLTPRAVRAAGLDHPILPFDILMLGGDDVMMVVPASVAFDVALMIAEKFRDSASDPDRLRTLSVGVALVPVKYPFGLARTIVETTLKFAKTASADARAQVSGAMVDDTRINFLVVTGGSNSNFKSVYNSVYHQRFDEMKQEFYATLRPYSPDDLRLLLEAIRSGHRLNLGRTKLHQLREAVLQMNLSTAVSEGMALLTNWRERQRKYVVSQVYEFGGKRQLARCDPHDPVSGFPRVTFPWFKDGMQEDRDLYRTSLLDFVELYDFLASKEVEDVSDED
jgi:hypothetical protein